MSLRNKGLIAIFISALLWGSAGVTAKLLFMETPPFVAAFHRFGLASLIILPFFLREKKTKGYIQALLPLGLFNAGNVLFYYFGLSLTTANTAAIIGTTVPITTALLSPLVINEAVAKDKMLGILVGLAGALYIVLLPLLQNGDPLHGSIFGNLLMVGSLACWTMYILHSRRALSKGTQSPLVATAMNVFAVTIASAYAALLSHQTLFPAALTSHTYIGTLFYASIGITIITFFLFQWGVQHVSAATASLKEYIQLIVAIGLNAAILGEQFTGAYVIGSVLVVAGVMLATGKRVSRKFACILFAQGE